MMKFFLFCQFFFNSPYTDRTAYNLCRVSKRYLVFVFLHVAESILVSIDDGKVEFVDGDICADKEILGAEIF